MKGEKLEYWSIILIMIGLQSEIVIKTDNLPKTITQIDPDYYSSSTQRRFAYMIVRKRAFMIVDKY